jgi:hypothetical protein
MDYDLADLSSLSHWEKLLTDEGVQAAVDLFPTKPDIWATALNKAGGSMTMPATGQLQEASAEAHGSTASVFRKKRESGKMNLVVTNPPGGRVLVVYIENPGPDRRGASYVHLSISGGARPPTPPGASKQKRRQGLIRLHSPKRLIRSSR